MATASPHNPTAYRILLVDDDHLIRQTLGPALEDQGWRVVTADSGETAVAALDRGEYDLVLTDLVMSGIDGLEVLRAARERHPACAVILLTGYGELRSAIEALRADADDYVLKPCNLDEILLRLRRCFERIELRRKVRLYEHILPVCCVCKKVRDDEGRAPGTGPWMPIETFILEKGGAEVTSTYCPECYEKTVAEWP